MYNISPQKSIDYGRGRDIKFLPGRLKITVCIRICADRKYLVDFFAAREYNYRTAFSGPDTVSIAGGGRSKHAEVPASLKRELNLNAESKDSKVVAFPSFGAPAMACAA